MQQLSAYFLKQEQQALQELSRQRAFNLLDKHCIGDPDDLSLWGRRINNYSFICPDFDMTTFSALTPLVPGYGTTIGCGFPVHCWVLPGGTCACSCAWFTKSTMCFHEHWLKAKVAASEVVPPLFKSTLEHCDQVVEVCLAYRREFISLADNTNHLGNRIVCGLIPNTTDTLVDSSTFFCACHPKGWLAEDVPSCGYFLAFMDARAQSMDISPSQQPVIRPGLRNPQASSHSEACMPELVDVCTKCQPSSNDTGGICCSKGMHCNTTHWKSILPKTTPKSQIRIPVHHHLQPWFQGPVIIDSHDLADRIMHQAAPIELHPPAPKASVCSGGFGWRILLLATQTRLYDSAFDSRPVRSLPSMIFWLK